MYKKFGFCVLLTLISIVSSAQGQGYLGGSLGYSSMSLEPGHFGEFHGLGANIRYGFSDLKAEDSFYPFLGLRIAEYEGHRHESMIWDITMVEPEAGVAWNIHLYNSAFFLETSVSVGPAFSSYTRGIDTGGSYLTGDDKTTTGWSLRPGVMLGYKGAGVELAYNILNIELTDERMVKELYVGLFYRFAW